MKLTPFGGHQAEWRRLEARASRSAALQGPPRLLLEFEWQPGWEALGLQGVGNQPAARRHELWRSTCFEAFLGADDGSYFELNLAPDGRWNAYRFEAYRLPQPPAEAPGWELLEFTRGAGHCRAVFRMPEGVGPISKVGLTAVIETPNRIEYWALHHPRPEADFHDAAGWIAGVSATFY